MPSHLAPVLGPRAASPFAPGQRLWARVRGVSGAGAALALGGAALALGAAVWPTALWPRPWLAVAGALACPAPRAPRWGAGALLPASAGPARPGARVGRGGDLDLAVSTDCEDLVAFAGDVFELGQQGRLLLLDALNPALLVPAAALPGLGLGAAALGVRALKRR